MLQYRLQTADCRTSFDCRSCHTVRIYLRSCNNWNFVGAFYKQALQPSGLTQTHYTHKYTAENDNMSYNGWQLSLTKIVPPLHRAVLWQTTHNKRCLNSRRQSSEVDLCHNSMLTSWDHLPLTIYSIHLVSRIWHGNKVIPVLQFKMSCNYNNIIS